MNQFAFGASPAVGIFESLATVPKLDCEYSFKVCFSGLNYFTRKLQSEPFCFSPSCIGNWIVELTCSEPQPGCRDIVCLKFITTDDKKLYGSFPTLHAVCDLEITNSKYGNTWTKALAPALVSTEPKVGQVDHPNIVINIELPYDPTVKIDFQQSLKVSGRLSFFRKQAFQFQPRETKPTEEKTDLAQQLKATYKNSSTCDVTFTFADDDRELKADKCILVTRSPVFATMFQTDMLEKKFNIVPVEDFDLEVFDSFLLFLYTDEIQDQSWDTVLSLYSAAGKYQVAHLRKVCSGIILSQLTAANVSSALVLADFHVDSELKDSCKYFMMCNFKEVAATDGWNNIMEKYPALATEIFRFMTTSMV